MKKIISFLAFLFILSQAVYAQNSSIKSYQKGDWGHLTKSFSGQSVAIHFWGVTCAPCAKEMPQWGRFISQNKNFNVLFIQVDEVSPEMVKKMISKAGLDKADNYNLTSPFDEYMRHEIDPKWRGETPITILIDKSGKFERKTGPIDFAKLQHWFKSGA